MGETDLNIFWIQYIQHQITHATDRERRYASRWAWRTSKEILEAQQDDKLHEFLDMMDRQDPWTTMAIRFNFVTWLFSKLINHEGPHQKDVWLIYMRLKDGRGMSKNDVSTLLAFFGVTEK